MALSLDVPFWPQLPNFSYYEDMYVQAAEHFPGIILDVSKRTLRFSIDRFAEEFEETLARFDDPGYFDISETYSAVYHRFLSLDLEVLSMDIYTNAEIFSSYAASIRRFLDKGGLIVWGIVPTGMETFSQEDLPSLIGRLESVWQVLSKKGVDRDRLLAQSMLSPATCCLVNPDKEKTVERAFSSVNQMSRQMRDARRLG